MFLSMMVFTFTCAQNQVVVLFWKDMGRRHGINLLVVHNHEILLYIYSFRKLEKIPFMLFPIEFSLLGNGMIPMNDSNHYSIF